jgi:cell shape-determining protein MreC
MLIRISLIVAVVAGLAVAVINFIQVKEVITTTRTARDEFEKNWQNETAAHSSTKKKLTGTEAELASTKSTLRQTEEVRDQALAEAKTKSEAAAKLAVQLKDTTAELKLTKDDLVAWQALDIPVDQVKKVIAQNKESQQQIEAQMSEIKLLTTKNKSLENELAYYRDPEYIVKLPDTLKGNVLISDPKWDFVVVNIGSDQGVLERGELLVNRDGKLVAKVRVFRVEKNRSIANLVSGWKIGEVIEGDSVIPAF